jgi:REP element-mobilizing transposase RayT
MHLSAAGAIVEACWAAVPVHFPHVATDAFVIMPNHIHGVIVIGHAPIGMGGALMGGGEGEETSPLRGTGAGADGAAAPRDALSWADGANADGGGAPKRTLGQIVAYFKYQAAKQINAAHGTPGAPVWQRGYYERIVRDDRALQLVRAYIAANPMRWARGERQSHR